MNTIRIFDEVTINRASDVEIQFPIRMEIDGKVETKDPNTDYGLVELKVGNTTIQCYNYPDTDVKPSRNCKRTTMTESVPVLSDITGLPTYDPNTGEPVMQDVDIPALITAIQSNTFGSGYLFYRTSIRELNKEFDDGYKDVMSGWTQSNIKFV